MSRQSLMGQRQFSVPLEEKKIRQINNLERVPNSNPVISQTSMSSVYILLISSKLRLEMVVFQNVFPVHPYKGHSIYHEFIHHARKIMLSWHGCI